MSLGFHHSFQSVVAIRQNFLLWLLCSMWFKRGIRIWCVSIVLPVRWMVSRRRCLPVVGHAVPSWMVFMVASVLSVVPKECNLGLCHHGCLSILVCLYMWWAHLVLYAPCRLPLWILILFHRPTFCLHSSVNLESRRMTCFRGWMFACCSPSQKPKIDL